MRVIVRSAGSVLGLLLLGAAAVPGGGSVQLAAATAPTFAKDVAPILYKACADCHRPGSIAPMALLSYDDVRPWARAVKQRVVSREMPPWGADPAVGTFANDPSLSKAEIDTIVAWVDGGAPEGNAGDLPKVPQFTEGWHIGKPDLVFKFVQPFRVPADGTVPYTYITVPTNLKEDVWVRGVEFRPTDRRVVHHIISDLVEGNGKAVDPTPRLQRDPAAKEIGGLGGYVPGRLDNLFDEGTARKIPAGANIVLQMQIGRAHV